MSRETRAFKEIYKDKLEEAQEEPEDKGMTKLSIEELERLFRHVDAINGLLRQARLRQVLSDEGVRY